MSTHARLGATAQGFEGTRAHSSTAPFAGKMKMFLTLLVVALAVTMCAAAQAVATQVKIY